jgi:ABC-type sugar transport system ATPase subunit
MSTGESVAKEPTETVIEMENIAKYFGRVHALNGVDISLRENEILGLLGDNGSGKSTLVKTLVGVHQPDSGTIRIRGEEYDFFNPKEARDVGISTVYQDLALVDAQSIAANMFLGRNLTKSLGGLPIVDWDTMNDEAERILSERLNIHLDPTSKVEYLSGGERQAIAIARALVTDPDIIVMDEPTSALSADAVERVEELIQTLQDEGLSILLISHNLDEVFNLTDRITVLKNGDHVGTVRTPTVSRRDIVQMMVEGRVSGGIEEDIDF